MHAENIAAPLPWHIIADKVLSGPSPPPTPKVLFRVLLIPAVLRSTEPTTTSSSHSEPPMPSSTGTRYTQHPFLWFEDGNIVLVAEGTAFRVHKCILCHNSEVLQDILGIPRSATPETTEMDSGRLVLLKVLHSAVGPFIGPILEFPEVAALARLLHKYQ
ncbi:hypothetical protein BD413DRAFT_589265 [Trametes elegans]|nr:hypothetical protein BD413DRAFT_589265 [Trametes elegans]